MGRRVNGIFLVIIFLGMVLRLKGITNPYLDDQGWRQADTASMALNMLGHLGDFPDVFFPMLNYDGIGPQPVELEFPIFPYLLAWTWTILGWQDLWGRLWSICFSLLTIWGVYKLGKLGFSERMGLWAAAIYAFLPLTTYYGRVVMPEPVAQAFSIWALVAILVWRRTPTPARLRMAAILMTGAILAKLPQLIIFPVALVLGFYPFRGGIGKMLIYSVSSLALPMLYYSWVHLGSGEASQFVSGILSYQVLENQTSYVQNLYKNLRNGLSFSLLLALAGVVLILVKKPPIKISSHERGSRPDKAASHKSTAGLGNAAKPESAAKLALLLWTGISLVYLGVICLKIPLDYYLVPVALPVALLCGYALEVWGGEGRGIPSFVVGVLIIALLWVSQICYYGVKYHWDERVLAQAEWIRLNTAEDSVLLLSGALPMTLYYSQRYGYRLLGDDQKAWEELQILPGDYLVALPNSRGEEFWQRVEGSFPQVGPGVYKVKQTP